MCGNITTNYVLLAANGAFAASRALLHWRFDVGNAASQRPPAAALPPPHATAATSTQEPVVATATRQHDIQSLWCFPMSIFVAAGCVAVNLRTMYDVWGLFFFHLVATRIMCTTDVSRYIGSTPNDMCGNIMANNVLLAANGAFAASRALLHWRLDVGNAASQRPPAAALPPPHATADRNSGSDERLCGRFDNTGAMKRAILGIVVVLVVVAAWIITGHE
jgi:hypothetical protein